LFVDGLFVANVSRPRSGMAGWARLCDSSGQHEGHPTPSPVATPSAVASGQRSPSIAKCAAITALLATRYTVLGHNPLVTEQSWDQHGSGVHFVLGCPPIGTPNKALPVRAAASVGRVRRLPPARRRRRRYSILARVPLRMQPPNSRESGAARGRVGGDIDSK
jgi:hypothetical protein